MYFTSGSYFLAGEDKSSSAKMARKAIAQYPAGVISPKALHKFFYCSLGTSSFYKGLKNIFGKKK
jgi:hypothetical protein